MKQLETLTNMGIVGKDIGVLNFVDNKPTLSTPPRTLLSIQGNPNSRQQRRTLRCIPLRFIWDNKKQMFNRLTDKQLLAISITFALGVGLIFTADRHDYNPLFLPDRVFGSYLAESSAILVLAAIIGGALRMFTQTPFLKLFRNCNFILGGLISLCLIVGVNDKSNPKTYANKNLSNDSVTSQTISSYEATPSTPAAPKSKPQPKSKTTDKFSYPDARNEIVAARQTTDLAKMFPADLTKRELNHILRAKNTSLDMFVEYVNTIAAMYTPKDSYVRAYYNRFWGEPVIVTYVYDKVPYINDKATRDQQIRAFKTTDLANSCPSFMRQSSFKIQVNVYLLTDYTKSQTPYAHYRFDWKTCQQNRNLWQ